jgi:hypothetical protein
MHAMRWLWIGAVWSALALVGLLTLPGLTTTVVIVWLLGLIALLGAALASPSGGEVVIYGPHGQSARVNEREALRRVHDHGWSYQPPDE